MPDIVFRIVLPVLWLVLVVAAAVNRWHVQRTLGHDPIVVRPWQRTGTPAGYLERAFSICVLLVTVDIAFNAISPHVAADALAIRALRTSTAVGYSGLILLTTGCALAVIAVRQMGASWRMGIDKQTPGPVVSSGLFARVRHPIHGGVLLATAGLAGVTADLFSVAVAAAVWVGIPVQARLEEAFLSSRYPQEYPDYLARTGRFWPRVP